MLQKTELTTHQTYLAEIYWAKSAFASDTRTMQCNDTIFYTLLTLGVRLPTFRQNSAIYDRRLFGETENGAKVSSLRKSRDGFIKRNRVEAS